MENKKHNKKRKISPMGNQNTIFWLILTITFAYIWYVSTTNPTLKMVNLTYSDFYHSLQEGKIKTAIKAESEINGLLQDGTTYKVTILESDQDLIKLLRDKVPSFEIKQGKIPLMNIFISFGPLLMFILFLYFIVYRGAQGGNKIFSFGKSRARQANDSSLKITFNDVAGVDEAKEELKEVVEFLKSPKKFTRLGGKMPKGVLLIGPPGTGKTLLAKAVSGEAGVPFYSISGSDFVEMFVGVGASRVRDLFEQAKKAAKVSNKGCIIFIDEIDAVGRQRFAGIGGGHDEREQTLNALLVEMDGFDTQEGVILVAATNRPDVLDPALLRPGRFDRQIVIDKPDLVGREAILKVHVKSVKLSENADLKSIASQTSGFSGADLANLVNEAALLAARKNKDSVCMEELEESIERVMAGPQKRSKIISKQEKKIVAYHEAGHALISLLVPNTDPLHKVSIIPRGTAALGYTMQKPIEDRYLTTREELTSRLMVLLAGRASEEIVFKDITTGAYSDLQIATEIAQNMVTKFGMSEKLGNLIYGKRDENIFLGRDLFQEKNYSEETAKVIDEEVKKIIDSCYKKSKELLVSNREKLEKLAERLIEKEVLDSAEVKELIKSDITPEAQKANV